MRVRGPAEGILTGRPPGGGKRGFADPSCRDMVGLTAPLADRAVQQPSKARAIMVLEMSRAVR